jgi:anti-sigma regulatory factor (Ser/Thr protein kinase)
MNGINVGLSRFHDFLVRAALPGTCAFDLEIVFYEVATNIRRHSGLAETDRIAFNVTVNHNMISLCFADTGRAFDPTLRTPDFNPRKAIKAKQTNGIGLTMIQRLVDTISYRRVNDRMNVVTLTRKLDWRG